MLKYFKEITLAISFLLTISDGYTQEYFKGTVIQQRFIKLNYKSRVKFQDSIIVSIKRLELRRYQIPYHFEVQRFIQSFDVELGRTVFEGSLKIDSSGMIQYEDHDVKQGYSYIYWLISASGKTIAGPLCSKIRDPNVWWSQEKIEDTMDQLTQLHPKLVLKHTFGKTHAGNPINGLLIGNLNKAIALIGYIHAGESGAELLLYSIEQILSNNKDLLEKSGIIIIPVLNIDSRNRLINGIPDYQRKNINGVDLNRNFPVNWEKIDTTYSLLTNDPFSDTYRGHSPASEPETKTIIQMIETYKPKVFFSYHHLGSITGNILLAHTTKNQKILDELHQYAESFNRGFYEITMDSPKYEIRNSDMPGTMHSYCLIKHNIPAYDVEGNTKYPILNRAYSDKATEKDLLIYQQKHYHAILSVLQHLYLTIE